MLTPREAEVLAAVTRHRTNAEIAAELYISVRTVETHVSSLLRKVGAADRRELAQRAGTALLTVAAPADRPELVGRDDELSHLAALLATGGLVTVLGPGGVGKTSLVRSLGGAIVVDLTALPAASGSQPIAALALEGFGVRLPDGRPAEAALAAEVVRRQVVLVLDNCEHLLEGAAAVAADLVRSAGVRVVATTRERLGLPGERILRLEPLSPDAALELFTRRAAALDPPVLLGPEQVSAARAVCTVVERLPLAVELAAARLAQLGLDDLAEAVAAGIDVLEGPRAAGRHRSVRSMLDWSYQLLAPADQRVHRWLSVLQGPFRIATASAVAGGGLTVAASVARLVDASLLVRGIDDRYRQLDLVRAHAGERLVAAGEQQAAEAALLAWATSCLDAAGSADEVADLRAAAAVAQHLPDRRGVDLLRRLAQHWGAGGRWQDAVDCWERAARASGDPADALAAAELAATRWQGDDAWRLFELVADLAETTDDPVSLMRSLEARIELGARFPATLHRPPEVGVLTELLDRARAVDAGDDLASEGLLACAEAWVRAASGDHVGAQESARRAVAVARAAEQPVLESAAWDALAGAAADEGNAALLDEASEERLALRDHLGGSPRAELERSDLETMAVDGALAVGRFAEARERADRLLLRERERELAHVGLGRLVSCEFHLGRFDEALDHAAEAVADWEAYGSGPAGYLLAPVSACVAISGYRGNAADERAWLAVADRISTRPEGATGTPLMRALRADAHLFHGRADLARQQLEVSPWDVSGTARSLYAAIRAVALGGEAVRDAERLVLGNRFAAALVARARGDHEGAVELFAECGAAFEVARTRLDLDPDDGEARAALDAFLGRRDDRLP